MVSSADAGSSHTNWSLIFDAARGEAIPASSALEKLARRYWPAIYAFIRKSGRDVHEAADLTQGFVCDVMITRNIFTHADPSRGRFRSLLLSSLQNYLKERHRHAARQKRAPATRSFRLEDSDIAAAEIAGGDTPEQAFATQWNATLIRTVLQKVQSDCRNAGLEAHWAVFEARVVGPMLTGEPRVSYAKLVERLELDDAGQAANMMVTVKRRFVQALVQEVGRTVDDPLQVEEEIREMLRDLEQRA